MAKAIALTRSALPDFDGTEFARAAIVLGCGLALIFAGPAFPL